MNAVYHIWLSIKSGYIFSSSPDRPVKGTSKVSYVGTTSDLGWPKKLSTGRILYKPNSKASKKKKNDRNNLTLVSNVLYSETKISKKNIVINDDNMLKSEAWGARLVDGKIEVYDKNGNMVKIKEAVSSSKN